MAPDECNELELRAYGKRISFHTRHHWILTWLEEQPGKSLADKVWGVIDRAYRADYRARGYKAQIRSVGAEKSERLAALNEAIECFQRSGDENQAQHLTNLLIHYVMDDAV